MKKMMYPLLGALALGAVSLSARAEDGPYSLSANVALTSDYVFRGITQTDEDPAIQGGFDFAHESGFYLGTWGSNVSFANMELDLYGGFANELANGLSYDVGYAHYLYFGDEEKSGEDLDMGELYAKFGFKMFSLEYYYNPDDPSSDYIGLGIAHELPQGFTLGASAGRASFDEGEDYTDWKIFVGTSLQGFDFELAYTDTDLEDNPDADGRAVFTVSRVF